MCFGHSVIWSDLSIGLLCTASWLPFLLPRPPILRIIDPRGEYFSHRILTQNESFQVNNKSLNLKALFPSGDHMVVIIDDSPAVWHYRPNLLITPVYMFALILCCGCCGCSLRLPLLVCSLRLLPLVTASCTCPS